MALTQLLTGTMLAEMLCISHLLEGESRAIHRNNSKCNLIHLSQSERCANMI